MMSSEWVPSHSDPDLIYGTSGSQFLRGRISTGATELIVDVGEPILLGQWEGGISTDDRFALVDSGQRLRVLDIQNKKVISGPYTVTGGLNGADISQDGQFLVWLSGGVTRYSDRNFDNVVHTKMSGHTDLCVDVNGDQVAVLFDTGNTVTFVRLKDGLHHTKQTFKTGNGHVSCTNYKRPGWAYLSTARGGQKAISIRLDYESTTTYEDWGFVREYVADYNNYDYDAQPKLSASPSGTQVVYTSTWNQTTKYRDFVLSHGP